MSQKSHWPFDDPSVQGSGAAKKDELEKARMAEQAALRQRMRHDRLIVGGRAHTKKHGLS